MVDPIDEARATLTDELNILAGLYHVGRGQLEAVRAAAVRLALAVFDLGVAAAGDCTPDVRIGRDRVTIERARLEGGSHAD